MTPFLFLLVAQGAGKPVHPPRQAIVAVDQRPVTAHEARAAFTKFIALLEKVNKRSLEASKIVDAPRPATREEIVAEMGRLYRAVEPIFRFTPASVPHDPSVFRIDPSQKGTLDRLVTRGCVGRIAPLAVGPNIGLTPREFGDALGFFVARIGQMTHMPSPLWTPMLKED